VIAVDVSPVALAVARDMGAEHTVTGGESAPVLIRELTGGGAHVSLDAFGSADTSQASVRSLRRRGTHVQVGLMVGAAAQTPMPMDRILAHELRIVGSHGMPAHEFGPMLELVSAGRLRPDRLVRTRIGLDATPDALARMGEAVGDGGITVIRPGAPATASNA
jgi:threonine dehydrogenase-like Zn-dependent dehydrogenase